MILRKMRYEYSTRPLWIDSICINQTNSNEKGHQVKLMARIYSGAFRVLVYIGESRQRSEAVLDTINGDSIFPLMYQAERPILSRSYFRRLWVLQEVALAKRATLICGDRSIPWNRFVEWFKNPGKTGRSSYLYHIDPGLPPVIAFDYHNYTDPHQLLDLLDLAVTCEADWTHDKVYAPLGLLPNATASGLVVDYQIPVEQVFGMKSVYAASICGWPRIFHTAASLGRSLETLRNWIPDWSSQRGNKPQESYGGMIQTFLIVDTPV
jgi:hypothetical protein